MRAKLLELMIYLKLADEHTECIIFMMSENEVVEDYNKLVKKYQEIPTN